METQLSDTARIVLEKVIGLRKLADTGINTNRTQRKLLLSLTDEDLATVARLLDLDGMKRVLGGGQ